MTELLFSGLLAFAISGLLTSLIVPVVRRLAVALNAVDHPGGRREHQGAVSRLGGVAIIGGLVFGVGSVAILRWSSHGRSIGKIELVAWLLGACLVFVVGLADDLARVSIWKRFLVELVAAGLIVAAGWRFAGFSFPGVGMVEFGSFAGIISVVWIVGVTNAINLIDGLDGLASGVIAIISMSLMVFAAIQNNLFSFILMAGIAGACLGFLRHNWAPATIFMGDTGSLTLGFLLGSMSVHASLKSSAAVAILVPFIALGVPVVDTLLVMLFRFTQNGSVGSAGRIRGMFQGDRNHMHHLLLPLSRKRVAVVRWIYAMVFLSCVGAIFVAITRNAVLGFALVVVEIAAVAFIRHLGFAKRLRDAFEARGENNAE